MGEFHRLDRREKPRTSGELIRPNFKTTLMLADGLNAAGIVIWDAIVERLGRGRKPKVTATPTTAKPIAPPSL